MKARIPLVGSYNTRNNRALPASFDQRFINFIPQIVTNAVTGQSKVYQEKRQGCEVSSTPASGRYGLGILYWVGYNASGSTILMTAWGSVDNSGGSTSNLVELYFGATNITNLDGFDALTADSVKDVFISETDISGEPTVAYSISDDSPDSINFTGAYYQQSVAITTTFVGDLHSNTTVDNIASTATLREGQLVTHASIPAGTRIATISSGTAILLSAAATGTSSGQTINRELVAKQIDADLPTNCVGGWVFMDGFAFIGTADGKIYNTDINSITAVTSTSFITAGRSPDGGVRCVRYKDFIVFFNRTSAEYFYNAGNSVGSPLGRVQQGAFRVGALRARNIAVAGDKVAWIGTEAEEAGHGVYMLEGVGYKKLSTPTIDKVLNSANMTTAIVGMMTANGQTIFTIYINAITTMYCYSFASNSWFELAPESTQYPMYVTGLLGASYFVSNKETSGRVYEYSPRDTSPQFTDNGSAYTATILTSKIDFGTSNRKFVSKLRLVGDTQASASAVNVSYSDDDYVTFSTPQSIDMSTTFKELSRLGSYKDGRAYKLTHAANTPCRLEALEFPEGSVTVGIA